MILMAKKQTVNIGRGIEGTRASSTDKHDPFAGNLGVRGATLVGTVTSDKAMKTVTIEMTKKLVYPKYKRLITKTYKVHAHNPESINAKQGDVVRIMETRPLSKTKHFCVVEIIKTEQQRDQQ